VGVSEAHPLPCQPVDVRRGDLAALRIEALDVAIAEVVAEDVDNAVRPKRPTAAQLPDRRPGNCLRGFASDPRPQDARRKTKKFDLTTVPCGFQGLEWGGCA
jgi:hypothetical protein